MNLAHLLGVLGVNDFHDPVHGQSAVPVQGFAKVVGDFGLSPPTVVVSPYTAMFGDKRDALGIGIEGEREGIAYGELWQAALVLHFQSASVLGLETMIGKARGLDGIQLDEPIAVAGGFAYELAQCTLTSSPRSRQESDAYAAALNFTIRWQYEQET